LSNFAQIITSAASLVVGTPILSKILQHASTALQLMVDSGTASCFTGRDLCCDLTFKSCAFCPGKFTTPGEREICLFHLPACQRVCSLCLFARHSSPILTCLDVAADFSELSPLLIHERQVPIFRTPETGEMADRCSSCPTLRNICHPKLRLSFIEPKSMVALAEGIHGARMKQIWKRKVNQQRWGNGRQEDTQLWSRNFDGERDDIRDACERTSAMRGSGVKGDKGVP
jgi:hypothetical protein